MALILGLLPSRAFASSFLFFSEYVEGTGNNQALEIYNPFDFPVSLSASGYYVDFFFDGSTSIGQRYPLQGVLNPGDVHVIAHGGADSALLAKADQTMSAGDPWFDGNDVVILEHSGTAVDVIGQIGVDPGTEWGSGETSTRDNTLRRLESVTDGDWNANDEFVPSDQWAGHAVDIFDGLGCYGEAACSPCSLASLTTVTAPSPGHGVVVRYDPHLIVPTSELDSTTKAGQVANAIRDRADYALTQYDALGFDQFTGPVTIDLVCEIVPVVPEWADLGGLLSIDTFGFTEGASKVKLRSDFVQREFKPIVDSAFTLAGWNEPPRYWVNTVDHEMFHTIQYAMRLVDPAFWTDYALLGNDTIFESGAMLAQDLIDDADDEPTVADGTYLQEVTTFFNTNPTIDGFEFPVLSPSGYQAAAVLQYLGERYGEGATQEAKVGNYLERISEPFNNRLSALQCGIANNPLCIGDDLFGALRDVQIAAYALDAPNVTPTENRTYQILDRDIAHGQQNGEENGTPYPPFAVVRRALSTGGSVDEPLTRLEHAAGRVYEISLPTGADWVRVTLDTQPAGGGDSRLRTAIIPVIGGNVAIDPGRMPQGPLPDERPSVSYVPTAGASKLAIVLEASEEDASYTLTVEDIAGPPAVTIVSPTQASPGLAQPGTFELVVRPTLGSAPASGLSASDFTVTIDGSVTTTLSEPQADGEDLRFWVAIQGTVSPSLHDLTVNFHGTSASETAAVNVVVPEPGNPPTPTESPAVGVLGPVGQGQTASIDAPITAGTGWATFQISWPGSDFDLTLHAPSGRVITESSSDPDVTVLPGTNTVAIRVTGPEAGVWQLDATGIDVATPEPVNYRVGESATPVLSRLAVTGGSEAGTPIAVSLAVTDTSGPLHAQVARAFVTDPGAVTRTSPLFDDGAHGDGRPYDGVFGAELWATGLPGTYSIDVRFAGKDESGSPVAREAVQTVSAAPMTDADSDGINDSVESRFGLVAGVADDADLEGDGISLSDELDNGVDPWSWDTDRGGENDASEIARGSDPRDPTDDADLPAVRLLTEPREGNIIAVSAGTSDGTGQVRLRREANSAAVDLGLIPGSGARLLDGPLPAGSYTYLATAIDSNGAESAPLVVGPYSPVDDATPPRLHLVINDGRWDTAQRAISVQLTDTGQPVVDMRLAESAGALATAAWVPFNAQTTFTLSQGEGQHSLFAQVRDASGLLSAPAMAVVDVDTIAPTSSAGPLSPQTENPTINVPYAAADEVSGVASVSLWWRYSADGGSGWTSWAEGPSSTSSPAPFTFASGPGFYEFYTIARDVAGNMEAAPPGADAVTQFGALWPASARINDDTGAQTQQERPAVVIGGDGAAYAVWDDMRNGNQTDIYFSRRDPATGLWGANVRVSDPTTRAQWQAAIAIDGADNAYAVWTDGREGNRQADDNIYFAKRSASTGAWGTNVRINDDTKGPASSQQTPRIAVNIAGEAAAVWVDRRAGRWDIYSSRLPAGSSTWTANLRIDDGSDWRRFAPDVAVASDGTLYAVWEADPWTNDQDIYWSKLTPGSSTWSPTQKLSDDPGTAAQYSPRIAVDTAGNVLAAWIDDRTSNSEVRSRRLPAGSSTWEPSILVSDAGADLPSDLALGMAPSGEALAAWSDARGATWDVWGAVYNPSSHQWRAATKISDGQTANEFRATVAMRGSHSVALWFDNRESWLGDIRSSYR